VTRSVRHLTPADARDTPWRNGRGTTREIAIAPAGASFERGDFRWRVAIAGVAEDGPFSSFPGFERLIVVIRGDGLVLHHGREAPPAVVLPFEPHRFDGSWRTEARLRRDAVTDFNVLFDPASVHATIDVLRLGARRWRGDLAAGDALLHLTEGTAIARVTGEEDPFVLRAGDSLLLTGLAGGEECELSGRADDTSLLHVALART
jgi:uncharacterized protein